MPDQTPAERVRRYHARSTHHPNRYAPGPGGLDWANQPDPFRTYTGTARVELPLAGDALGVTWGELHRSGGTAVRPVDRTSLGAFLELALGLTAWKEFGASRWSLRANPSSGNLHPTEGYVLVPSIPGVDPGLHHYVSRDHVLERRWTPDRALDRLLPEGTFLLGLASIHWREAWKYGERAFRYCQHDAGHALAAVRYSAAILGWSARLLDAPGDDDVAAVLGLDREEDLDDLPTPDREHPDALVLVAPPGKVEEGCAQVEVSLDALVDAARAGEWAGRPNALSPSHVAWEEIEGVATATRKPRTPPGGRVALPEREMAAAATAARAVDLVRQRRSAVDMDSKTSLTGGQLFAILDRLLPRPGVPPWDLVPWSPRIHPLLFVHRVEGLAAGLYVLDRSDTVHERLGAATRATFSFDRVGPGDSLPLFLLEEGDTRSMARFASCHQAIAADSAFSLGMLSVFDPSLAEGAWWYRRLFWEAGVLGQVLYLEAEARGVRGTGIGCYFDDVVHEILGLEDIRFRDLYHFTVGGPVDDPRLATRPAYPPAVRARS